MGVRASYTTSPPWLTGVLMEVERVVLDGEPLVRLWSHFCVNKRLSRYPDQD